MAGRVLFGTGAVAVIALPGLISKVHAADNSRFHNIKISQLPLYDDDEHQRILEIIPKKPNFLNKPISEVRKSLWNFMQQFDEQWRFVKEKAAVGKAHTEDFITYIQDDAGIVPRLGFITVSALGGIVAGYRGGKFRKTVLCILGGTVAASVCYPNEAVDVTRIGWGKTKQQSKNLYYYCFPKIEGQQSFPEKLDDFISTAKKMFEDRTAPVKEVVQTTSKDVVYRVQSLSQSAKNILSGDAAAAPDNVDTNTTTSDVATTAADINPIEDHGMSKTEDKDLYSTRSN